MYVCSSFSTRFILKLFSSLMKSDTLKDIGYLNANWSQITDFVMHVLTTSWYDYCVTKKL